MGVVEKLKQLHKQTLLKLKDIKRVVIADEAGVNNEGYLNRARTLKSYLGNEVAPSLVSGLPETGEVGVPIEYESSTYAGDFEDTPVYAEITITNHTNVKFEYWEEDSSDYIEFPESDGTYVFGIKGQGFPLKDKTSKFRITFNQAAEYTVSTRLVDDNSGEALATSAKTCTVSAAPTQRNVQKTSARKLKL